MNEVTLLDQSSSVHDRRKYRRPHMNAIVLILVGLVILALAAVVVFQYLKLNSSEISQEIARKVQNEVSKLMILPDEEALVSSVDDADATRQQPFFAQVENGDHVLIFVQAAKIVIYRPSTNKIINVGPIVDDRSPEIEGIDSTVD